MDNVIRDLRTAQEAFFASRSWQSKRCPVCSHEYYTKGKGENCGSYDCVRGYAFQELPPPKAFMELAACIDELSRFFGERGLLVSDPIAMVRNRERTLFASTGGQIYDDLVYSRKYATTTETRFVAQPVIRLQERRSVGLTEGFSTSFIHAATECWNADANIHVTMLDAWLSAFSALGFYAGGLCLMPDQLNNDWAGLSVPAESIRINYRGLEIGIANFFLVPLSDGSHAVLSDIGVGAERLSWAINKSGSYFDAIGPLVSLENSISLDAIRTAVLMVGSGVRPDVKGHGSKLRAILMEAPGIESRVNLFELVRYYYVQWRKFIPLSRDLGQVYGEILREANRNASIALGGALRVGGSIDRSPEEFVLSAIRSKKLSLQELRRAMKGGV